MSSSSPLKLSSHRAAGKPERLLRAAVTAFCSIPRPDRRETAQLDDLAVPLLERVSDDTLRFTAAALSDTPFAPPMLIRRLCDRPVDICAPILMRSPVLTNIDLLALIGRHGLAHARAIAARPRLDPRIVRLIASIGAFETEPAPGKVEQVRGRLRAMMLPGEELRQPQEEPRVSLHWQGTPDAYRKLRSTALTGVPALFHTALADSLDIDMERARDIADGSDVSALIVAMRALDLGEEQAFLVFQCVWPERTGNARSVRAFLDAWQAVSKEQAEAIVGRWREPHRIGQPANEPNRPDALKAS